MHHGGLVKGRTRDKQQKKLEDALGGDIPQILKDKLEIAQDPEGFKRRLVNSMYHGRKVLTSSAAVLRPKPKEKGK